MKKLFVTMVFVAAVIFAYFCGFKFGQSHRVFISAPHDRAEYPPYEIYADDILSFDFSTLRCPLCGSAEITKEWYDSFYGIKCRFCGTEGKVVPK